MTFVCKMTNKTIDNKVENEYWYLDAYEDHVGGQTQKELSDVACEYIKKVNAGIESKTDKDKSLKSKCFYALDDVNFLVVNRAALCNSCGELSPKDFVMIDYVLDQRLAAFAKNIRHIANHVAKHSELEKK